MQASQHFCYIIQIATSNSFECSHTIIRRDSKFSENYIEPSRVDLIFSSSRIDVVSLIHLLNVGGVSSLHKSNIWHLARRGSDNMEFAFEKPGSISKNKNGACQNALRWAGPEHEYMFSRLTFTADTRGVDIRKGLQCTLRILSRIKLRLAQGEEERSESNAASHWSYLISSPRSSSQSCLIPCSNWG